MSENLATRINAQIRNLTKTERRLANFLTVNPERLLLETNSSLADQAGVSPMTVSRFVQKIGFKDMADAKRVMKAHSYDTFGPMGSEIGTRFERVEEARKLDHGDRGAIEADSVGIHRAYAMRRTPLWEKIIKLVTSSDSVYVTGFQTTDYMARGMAMLLLYARPDVHYLSFVDGIYANALTESAEKKTLIIFDVFRYAKNGPLLAKFAKQRGYEVIVICDEFCDWAEKATEYHLSVSPNTRYFFSSMGSVHVLMNLLVHDVIDELGEQAKTHMDTIWQAQEEFGQYF
jgi:DNA-binding MurR/RpiR family transcriptional regulator